MVTCWPSKQLICEKLTRDPLAPETVISDRQLCGNGLRCPPGKQTCMPQPGLTMAMGSHQWSAFPDLANCWEFSMAQLKHALSCLGSHVQCSPLNVETGLDCVLAAFSCPGVVLMLACHRGGGGGGGGEVC